MILRFFIVFLLTLFSIVVYEASKYLEIKNYYIQKEINKYDKLINELKQIEKLNKKLNTFHIPVYSKQQAQNIILTKIDYLLKTLPIKVKEYKIEDNKITAHLLLNIDIKTNKEKKEVINIFKTYIPINNINYFSLQQNYIQMKFNFTMPYKEKNDNK